MRPLAAIVGAGCTRFGDRLDAGLKELFVEAWREAVGSVDKGLDPKRVREGFIGSMSSSGHQIANLAGSLMEQVGLRGLPAVKVENACASGSYALRMGLHALAAGADLVLVGGVEKMREVSGWDSRRWLGVGGDTENERFHGLTFPGVFALMARRHMEEFGTKPEHFAAAAVKNHANAAENPKAALRNKITVEDALRAPRVAAPLGLYDCCPAADGAAALLVCRPELAKEFTDTPVYVAGQGAATDTLAFVHRKSVTTLEATVAASREAYRQAGTSAKEVDLAEVHDCFTPSEIVACEDLGFCEKGQGGPYVASGATALDGDVPVNASGGLKAKGHPIGATGVGQLYEVWTQLRGAAGKRQVKGAEIGLTHNMGGFGVACAVTVLRV